MERDDWMENDQPFFKVFCPVSAPERAKRLSPSERRSSSSAVNDLGEGEGLDVGTKAVSLSALELRYD